MSLLFHVVGLLKKDILVQLYGRIYYSNASQAQMQTDFKPYDSFQIIKVPSYVAEGRI